jgi:hypothetical protein
MQLVTIFLNIRPYICLWTTNRPCVNSCSTVLSRESFLNRSQFWGQCARGYGASHPLPGQERRCVYHNRVPISLFWLPQYYPDIYLVFVSDHAFSCSDGRIAYHKLGFAFVGDWGVFFDKVVLVDVYKWIVLSLSISSDFRLRRLVDEAWHGISAQGLEFES